MIDSCKHVTKVINSSLPVLTFLGEAQLRTSRGRRISSLQVYGAFKCRLDGHTRAQPITPEEMSYPRNLSILIRVIPKATPELGGTRRLGDATIPVGILPPEETAATHWPQESDS